MWRSCCGWMMRCQLFSLGTSSVFTCQHFLSESYCPPRAVFPFHAIPPAKCRHSTPAYRRHRLILAKPDAVEGRNILNTSSLSVSATPKTSMQDHRDIEVTSSPSTDRSRPQQLGMSYSASLPWEKA